MKFKRHIPAFITGIDESIVEVFSKKDIENLDYVKRQLNVGCGTKLSISDDKLMIEIFPKNEPRLYFVVGKFLGCTQDEIDMLSFDKFKFEEDLNENND